MIKKPVILMMLMIFFLIMNCSSVLAIDFYIEKMKGGCEFSNYHLNIDGFVLGLHHVIDEKYLIFLEHIGYIGKEVDGGLTLGKIGYLILKDDTINGFITGGLINQSSKVYDYKLTLNGSTIGGNIILSVTDKIIIELLGDFSTAISYYRIKLNYKFTDFILGSLGYNTYFVELEEPYSSYNADGLSVGLSLRF